MTFTLGLLASSATEVDWSRPLMIGWLVVALGLGLIEIWLAGGFRHRGFRPVINGDLAIVNSSKPFALNTTRVNDDLLTLSLGTNYAHASTLRAGNSGHRRLSRP